MYRTPRFDPERHYRRSLRKRGFDYTSPGYYFVTFCTQDRLPHFGRIRDGTVALNAAGRRAHAHWRALVDHHPHVRLHAFVVMPDHIHGVVELIGRPSAPPRASNGPPPGSLGSIVGSYRAGVTRAINAERLAPVDRIWQRGYHDIIIRDERALARITAYIMRHPRMVL